MAQVDMHLVNINDVVDCEKAFTSPLDGLCKLSISACTILRYLHVDFLFGVFGIHLKRQAVRFSFQTILELTIMHSLT